MQDATISGFHAHVYFDAATRERACALWMGEMPPLDLDVLRR